MKKRYYEYQVSYRKQHYVVLRANLVKGKDDDIIAYLEGKNKNAVVREAIRQHMNRAK